MLRPDPDLGQAGRLRHPAAREEGLLRPRLQRGEGRTALGQRQAEVGRGGGPFTGGEGDDQIKMLISLRWN